MKIEKIKLVYFRGHQNTELSFDKRLTVIVGENGSGKSSILDAVSICLSWIIARIKNPRGQGAFISHESVYLGAKDGLIAAFYDEIEQQLIPNKTKAGFNKPLPTLLDSLNHYALSLRESILRSELKTSIPVFVHYGVKRAVVDIPLRIKKAHIFDLFEAYTDCLSGDASFRTFFEWFRNQEDMENEQFKQFYNLFSENKSELKPDRELSTVRRALSIFLPTYQNIRVSRNPLQMLVEKEGVTLRMDQLSDGEKIFIALIGDLCRRLVLANPTLEDPLQGEGIVLIDELDLHLHPKWQTDIAMRLIEVFPNLQFIVTTHSPLVITNIPSSSLRILKNEEGMLSISDSSIGYGLPTSVIMKDLMGLENELPKQVEDLLLQTYASIQQGQIEEATHLYSALVALSPQLPELVRIRKLIELKSRR